MRFPQKKRKKPTIHLTALIDIVFLLLIFFLLTSSFVDQQGVVIIVPDTESEAAELLPDLIVQVDRFGVFYFDRIIARDQDTLFTLLQNKMKSSSKENVIIQADHRVQYDHVVQAIDAAKLAGAKSILLATKRRRPTVGFDN